MREFRGKQGEGKEGSIFLLHVYGPAEEKAKELEGFIFLPLQ